VWTYGERAVLLESGDVALVGVGADAARAAGNGAVLTAPGPGRRRRWAATTPARIRLLALAVAVPVAALAVVFTLGARGERAGLDVIGHRTAPVVVASSDLYFVLNDMDAQLANVLLVGDETTLGFTRAQALTIYEQRRQQAVGDLQQVAAASAGQSVRDILDAFGRYQALAAQTILLDQQASHPAGQPPAAALAQYRQATDLLKATLLPAARDLADRNAQTLERTYQDQHGATLTTRTWIGATGIAALVVLLVAQVLLFRRFRRLFNPALVAATLLTGALTVSGVVVTTGVAGHLRAAKKDAFDSILVLSQARAVSYDANADESRYLLDPARAAQYEQAFLTKTQQLVTLPGATLATFDQRLAAARNAYQQDNSTIGWQGFLGTEFRNITFTGERAAAETTLQRYQTYQLDDRRIRALATGGHLRDAIALCTSYTPGDSNYAFDSYDKALAALIDINQHAFDQNISDGQQQLTGWTVIPPAVGLAVLGLLVVGLRRRLVEYR